MNLADIRGYVTRRLDFNPNLASWKAGIDADINKAYLEIADAFDWNFLRQEGTVTMLTDIIGATGTTIEIAAANRRRVLCTGFTPNAGFAGQLIDVGTNTYRIGSVNGTDIYLDETASPTVAAGHTDFTIRQERIAMPRDCSESMRFISRSDNYGLMTFIAREEAALYNHQRQAGGSNYTLIDMSPVMVSAPEYGSTLTSDAAAGGVLTVGDEWEVVYTFEWMGIESPPSAVATVTIAATHDSIIIAGLEDTRWNTSTTTTNKQKAIYARNKTNGGRWHKVTTAADSDPSFTFTGATLSSHDEKDDDQRLFVEGVRQYVEPWHRPGANTDVHVEYLMRPFEMVADADVPQIPYTFHDIIPMKVMMDLFADHSDTKTAEVWRRRYEKRLEELKNRYAIRSASRTVKKSMVGRLLRTDSLRVGTVTKL